MRIIKFRAWNQEHKRMSESFSLEDLALFRHQGADFKGSMFMQFIGLKDKTGVEIYEGDLFQVANNIVYEVLFITETNGEIVSAFGIKSGDESFPIDEYAVKNGKVIGNIYENADLIQKTR